LLWDHKGESLAVSLGRRPMEKWNSRKGKKIFGAGKKKEKWPGGDRSVLFLQRKEKGGRKIRRKKATSVNRKGITQKKKKKNRQASLALREPAEKGKD